MAMIFLVTLPCCDLASNELYVVAMDGDAATFAVFPHENRVLVEVGGRIEDLSDMHECIVLSRRKWHCKQNILGNEWRMSDGVLTLVQRDASGFTFTKSYYSGIRGLLVRWKVFLAALDTPTK